MRPSLHMKSTSQLCYSVIPGQGGKRDRQFWFNSKRRKEACHGAAIKRSIWLVAGWKIFNFCASLKVYSKTTNIQTNNEGNETEYEKNNGIMSQ